MSRSELGGLIGNIKCTKCQDLQSVEVGHYKEADEENSMAVVSSSLG